MSKIIKIWEHHISIPTPIDRAEIININERKENAYWRRLGPNNKPVEIDPWPEIWYKFIPYFTKVNQKFRTEDEDGNLLSITEDDTKLLDFLLKREMHRRVHGVHMKNGDKITWICGDYYFNLQWAPMHGLSSMWGQYRHFQNDALIQKWSVTNNEDIAGMDLYKPKKTGITQIWAGAYVNGSTMTEKKIFAMMSKTGDDVIDTNMMYYFYILDALPPIFRPRIKKRNESEIIYGIPAKRSSGTEGSLLGQVASNKVKKLDTRVFASKTKESGFDGPLIFEGWVDEFPKSWEGSKVSPDAIYKKTIETVKLQQEIRGKLWYTSYVVEIDDKGFHEAKAIWNKSRLSTLNKETGRTESTMINHLITLQESAEGMFNKYGYCDQQKAFHFITNAINSATSSGEKQRWKRQYPTSERDVWDSGGSGSAFDNIRLGERKRQLDELMQTGSRPWREGRFRWENSLWEGGIERPKGQFCNVYFEELSDDELIAGKEGRVRMRQDIPADLRNKVLRENNRNEFDDQLCPFPDNEVVGSWDPTDYVVKADIAVGSKHSGHTFNLFNPITNTRMKAIASKVCLWNYWDRPDDPDEAYEDMVKEIIYSGKMMIIEANKKWMITRAKKDGLHHFLLLLDENGIIRPYKEGDENNLVNTNRDMIEAYCRAIARYFRAIRSTGEIDYLAQHWDPDDIDQCMMFEPLNTKKFDKVVSLGYVLLAMEAYEVFKLNQQEEPLLVNAESFLAYLSNY